MEENEDQTKKRKHGMSLNKEKETKKGKQETLESEETVKKTAKVAVKTSKKIINTIIAIKDFILAILNPAFWKALLIIATIATLTITFTALIDYLFDFKEYQVNSKAQMITDTLNAEETKPTVVTNVTSRNNNSNRSGNAKQIKIQQKDDYTGYEFSYDNTPQNLEAIKEQLSQRNISIKGFSNFEIAVLGAFIDNGTNLDYYTEEELKCFATFFKVEAATKNLDLRPNGEKESGKTVGDYIENYEPEKRENLAENEVPGIILVQRTNTNSDTPITLEYKNLSDFKNLVDSNDSNAINYFSISEDGDLLIAKWEHVLITVDGEYPENIDEAEKDIPTGENGRYILKLEPIAYSEYVAKYTMPFEFLIQLLVVTQQPSFCMKLADYALDSKIVINIQEEQTVTVTDETKDYTAYTKESKYIDYELNVTQKPIYKLQNYFLNYARDDSGNECTNYIENDSTVKVHTEYTSHSYIFEIVEADTWIASYKKTYAKQPAIIHPTTTDTVESKGEYERSEIEGQPITDVQTINSDNDVTRFINETEPNYEPRISVPSITINSYTDILKNKFKTISFAGNIEKVEINGSVVSTTDTPTKYYEVYEVKDYEAYATGKYNLPSKIIITTKKVESTDKTVEIPELKYTYNINADETKYVLEDNIDPLVECKVTKLNIEKFQKLDLTNNIKTTITEHPADSNPVTQTYIYAKDKDGNFEKFLKAYDKSPGAQSNLSGIDSWLYEMMEKREETVELVNIVKYLLYIYDGQDRGVTELVGFEGLFESGQFATFSNGSGWWWPIGSSNIETINGVKFAKGEPVSTKITSGVGPRWGKNHGGIDISNGIRGTNIIAAKSGTVTTVVDGFGDGHAHVNGSVHGSQKVCNGECKQGVGYGNHIKIQHDDGTVSVYAHLEKGTIKVSQGDRVEQGQLLGGMGTSGSSTGIHLHFEIRDAKNTRLDPEEYVDPSNPRPTLASSRLRDWLWGIEGGSQYINGNVWTVFDPEGADNTMNLAHGMVIASYNGADSWYPDIIPGKITVGQTVTAEQANKIWEKKVKGFNDAIDSACAKYGVTLSPNQKDALVSYIYRTGYGKGQNNLIVSAYASGGNAGLWNYMKEGYDKRAQYEAGTKKRIAEEYELFVKGDYKYDPNGTTKYEQYCKNPNI